jgi:signal transduction histidine kinase
VPAFVRTTWFRLALLFTALQLAVVLLVLGGVYRLTAAHVDARMDQMLASEIETLEVAFRRAGLAGLAREVAERSEQGLDQMIYLLADPRGARVVGNLTGWPAAVLPDGTVRTIDLADPTRDGRSVPVAARAFGLPAGHRILVGIDRSERLELQDRIGIAFAWAVGLTLVAGLVVGGWFGRRALRQVDVINATATRIVAGDLGERIPRSGAGDELDRLAENLNRMLDRIAHLMGGLRGVTDAVAHDLRTPLTRLRARLETALARPDLSETARPALEACVQECDRLLGIFRALLGIAEAEAAAGGVGVAEVELATLAGDVVDLYAPAAEEKGLALDLRVWDGAATVMGNAQLLAQALANLLDNAVKFTPPTGRIVVTVDRTDDGRPRLCVADTGPGIPAAARASVLDRFVRLDASRTDPGHGLGLSLVDAVARRHGARLSLEDASPGLRVVMLFPGIPARLRTGVEGEPAGR